MAKNWSILVDPFKERVLLTVHSNNGNVEMLLKPDILSEIIGDKNESKRTNRTTSKT